MKMASMINNLYLKYNKISSPAKASIWFAICTVLQKGISLLTTPIFTRIMTTTQYGVYSVYQSWYMIISTIATLHLAAGVYNNGLLKYGDDKNGFTSAMLGLSSMVTIIVFVIYIIGHAYWNKLINLSTPVMLAMFTELIFVPAYSFWAAEQRFFYKYRSLIGVTLIISLASPLLGIFAVLSTTYKAEARIFSYVLVQVLVGFVLYIIAASRSKTFFSKKYWTYALAFNLPLVPHYLSRNILNQSDRIMIEHMVGASWAGIYSIAYTISMMMSIITTAINASYTPYTYTSIKADRISGLRNNTSVLAIASCAICICIIAFGPEVISLIASPEYYDARWVVPPVASASYFIFVTGFYGNVLFYYEKTRFIMFASLIAAILNIGLNYISIPKFGYISAAYTTLICQIIMFIAYFIFYKLQLKANKKINIYNDVAIFLSEIIIVVFSLAITLVYDIIIIRYAVIILIITLLFIKKKVLLRFWQDIKKGKKQ